LSKQGLDSCSARILPKDTVLMSSRAPIGYVAIAANEIATNQGFKNFICNSSLHAEYLFYWLKFKRDAIEEMGSGSTFTEISGSKCKEIPIHYPPIDEQKRIVAVVDKLLARVNGARERLARIPKLLKRFRQSVLAAACSGRLTEDWRAKNPDVEPASKLLERILKERRGRWEKDRLDKFKATGKAPEDDRWKSKYIEPEAPSNDSLPGLPPKWIWATFNQCAFEITVGHVGPMREEYAATGTPFLRSQNVRCLRFDPKGLEFIPKEFESRLEKSRLFGGEILVVRSGANVGDCCVYPETAGNANCADLVITRTLRGLNANFGAMYIESPLGEATLRGSETGIAQASFQYRCNES
jgi:type I restriction enzyme S subunit